MTRTTKWVGMFAGALLLAGIPASAADDPEALQDVIEVLKQRGILNDGDYTRISAKNAAYEKKLDSKLPKISLWGDFRARHESFFYDRDESGSERDNRYRARYRLRLNGKAEVNDWASVHFRLISGGDDQRSTNQTLGSSLDFDSDPIRIDHAYVELQRSFDNPGTFKLRFGKVPNPFLWKVGKDFMLWDNDISPEGASASYNWDVDENLEVFANTGYFIIDENSTTKDPHVVGFQGGSHYRVNDAVKIGARATYYRFGSLDAAFSARNADSRDSTSTTAGGGNIIDGLTGSTANEEMAVIEAGGYVRWDAHESWPVLVYGDWSQNLDAEEGALAGVTTLPCAGGCVPNSIGVQDEDVAWGVGMEVGSPKEYVKLGAGFWHIEANAFPSQFIDSDITGGFTNREGFIFYGSRDVFANTTANLTVFVGDEIDDTLAEFVDSVLDAERVRVQADMVFKF